MDANFDRILNLAQRSNSRLIIYDRTAGKHLVVMGIDDFENLSTGRVPVQVADDDAEKDHQLIQKLNQEIAEWREKAQKPPEVEEDSEDIVEDILPQQQETPQLDSIPPVPPTPPISNTPSPWHRLGDVIARYQPAPRMPEVRYEPNPTEVGEKTESLEDEAIFLEEPVE